MKGVFSALLLSIVSIGSTIAVGGTAACGGGATAKVPGVSSGGAATTATKPGPAGQAIIGHLLGSIAERTMGPFLARSVDGRAAMALWMSAPEGSGRQVLATPLTGVGEPRGPAKTVANVGVDATMLISRPTRGKVPGFGAAWTVLTDRGEALWVTVLGEDGAPRSKPIELARTADDIVWVDIVPTDEGALCVWAEETRAGDANLTVVGLDTDGKIRGVPTRVARGVSGWHVLEVPGGVGVSWVRMEPVAAESANAAKPAPKQRARASKAAAGEPPAPRSESAVGGTLSYQRLDAEGRPATPPVVVVPTATVSGDVEIARAGERIVFAWTDRTAADASIAAAALTADGKPEPMRRVVEARGGAALLGLASGPAGVALSWESPLRRGATTERNVRFARIGNRLEIASRPTSLTVFGRAAPELVATGTGFAMLASLPDCEQDSPRCPDAPILPTILRMDGQLAVVQREALSFGTDPASLAWGLTCHGDACLTLAASGSAPARVRAAELRPRTNVKSNAIASTSGSEGPSVLDVAAIMTGESVVDLAAARIGVKTALVTLSSKVEAPRAKHRGVLEDARNQQLVLTTRLVDESGRSGHPIVVTTRALAVGGVSIAAADAPDGGGAIAWVARDGGDLEVHVTKIDSSGKPTKDVQLTTMKGDASDVAIAWAGSGWIVAWVDGRDGNGEVYATKVGSDLSRNPGERITNAPGDASDLVARAAGDVVWLAWADPRESPRDGMADVFVAAVGAKDAKRVVEDRRVLASAAHSRTPQLAPGPNGSMYVAWIEEAPLGAESPASSGYGAMWATLGEDGQPSKKPTKLPSGGEGAATSVALAVESGTLRAIVARSTHEAIAVDAVQLEKAAERAVPLFTLDGPPSLDVALVLMGDAVYFNDDGPQATDKRARRAQIAWRP